MGAIRSQLPSRNAAIRAWVSSVDDIVRQNARPKREIGDPRGPVRLHRHPREVVELAELRPAQLRGAPGRGEDGSKFMPSRVPLR